MISPNIPDTRYDYTHPWWQNANDRVAYERAFQEGDFEARQVAQAMLSANPLVTRDEIRAKNRNAAYIPPKFGYNVNELNITDIIDNDIDGFGHVDDSHTTDFSGRLSNTEATSRPGIYW